MASEVFKACGKVYAVSCFAGHTSKLMDETDVSMSLPWFAVQDAVTTESLGCLASGISHLPRFQPKPLRQLWHGSVLTITTTAAFERIS